MPPLPTSLIVVGLVAAWLVVLVPMVARRREHVPESDESSAGFRVLRRASASLRRRRPVMSRTAVQTDDLAGDGGEPVDDDMSEAEDDWAQQNWESDPWDADGDEDADVDGQERDDALVDDAVRGADMPGGDATVGDDELALAGDDPVRADRGGDAGMDPGDDAGPVRRYAAAGSVHDAAEEWSAEHPAGRRGERPVGSGRLAEPRYAAQRTSPTRSTEPRRIDAPRSRTPRPGRERLRAPEPEWQDDAQVRPVPLRPGRGGFDPEAAEQARAYRYRRRRRIVMALLAIAAVCAVLGVLGLALAWAGAAVAAVLLAMYLAYLRRQVRIEESIRQRRAARLERARQIRPVYRASVAEQVRVHRTGGLRRPVTDDEASEGYRVVSHARPSAASVPPAQYRPGVVVDLDDDDPAFDDLEYYRPVTYRRAAGE